jgi:sec-independent protein translocase protein TatA
VERLSCPVVIGDILQPTHLLFILVVALLVLGPKRLPEVGRSLGKGLRDFKTALSGDEPQPLHDEVPQQTSTETSPPAAERAEHIS